MPKTIEPAMGHPVVDFIDGQIEHYDQKTAEAIGHKRTRDRELWSSTHTVLSGVKRKINPGTCAANNQVDLIKMLALDGAERLNKGENFHVIQRDLVILCNSFNLQCENCLNAECEIRDPNIPTPEATE